MRHSAEYQRFDKLVGDLLSVSREEMQRREEEYRKQVEANPNRPGPKRGTKRQKRKTVKPPSASGL
jgi:hypothetical protein